MSDLDDLKEALRKLEAAKDELAEASETLDGSLARLHAANERLAFTTKEFLPRLEALSEKGRGTGVVSPTITAFLADRGAVGYEAIGRLDVATLRELLDTVERAVEAALAAGKTGVSN